MAFELKKGKFRPADAGQLNFYLNMPNEKIKPEQENSSIGIVLCKEKNNTVVEFAIKRFDNTMGEATYKTSKQTPVQMKGILPHTDELVSCGNSFCDTKFNRLQYFFVLQSYH